MIRENSIDILRYIPALPLSLNYNGISIHTTNIVINSPEVFYNDSFHTYHLRTAGTFLMLYS